MRWDSNVDLIGDAFEVDIYGSRLAPSGWPCCEMTSWLRFRACASAAWTSWTPEVAPDTSRSTSRNWGAASSWPNLHATCAVARKPQSDRPACLAA
jgi:hypothetical protein